VKSMKRCLKDMRNHFLNSGRPKRWFGRSRRIEVLCRPVAHCTNYVLCTYYVLRTKYYLLYVLDFLKCDNDNFEEVILQ
jgi:hypothetical protein